LRALQVTDELAGQIDADAALLQARRDWLNDAGEADAKAGFQAETLVRPCCRGRWRNPMRGPWPPCSRRRRQPGMRARLCWPRSMS
jgi:hypothetical protein